ncbi:unnamed protein product [Darwinula stevensoni]|uniref:Uncharacterized protein n=1 Tax=Darwinula stevensoni TaxID=69355 RepID=A0A7R9A4N5_9CRUS|nr:unnamed protein product [Darwinula stevensoni]CAG0892900.1 unnamed protein product [Darwinula stevensoni]
MQSKSFEEFLEAPVEEMRNRSTRTASFPRIGRNQMSFDLGLDERDFEDEDKVEAFVEGIREAFPLVLIVEDLEESLVLLRHRLCCSLEDVVHFSRNVRSERKPLKPDERRKLAELNAADEALYEAFSTDLRRKVLAFGEGRMADEKLALRCLSEAWARECRVRSVSQGEIPPAVRLWKNSANLVAPRHEWSREACSLMAFNSVAFLKTLRARQLERTLPLMVLY